MALKSESNIQSRVSDESGMQRPTFAQTVRGQASLPLDLVFAKLIRDLYDDENRYPDHVGVWTRVSDDTLRQDGIDPTLLKSDASGFLAGIYSDAQGRYVLAFAGTDEPKDWLTNFGQGLGFETAQYNQAIALSRQAKIAYGQELVVTGQSLGGGLAAVAALTSDIPAVTFNAAGVHDKTLERVGLDAAAAKTEGEQNLVRRYAVQNDILTQLQEHTPMMRALMPDAIGHKIELPDPHPLTSWQRLNPVKSIKHGVDVHYIEGVIESMELMYGKDYDQRVGLHDAAHPANGLYEQSLRAMQTAKGKPPELQDGQIAAALVVQAQKEGLQRIDAVVFSEDGRRAFAVQGDTQSSTRRYAQMEVAQAARTPLADSSLQSVALAQAAPQAQPTQITPAHPPRTY